MAEEPKEEKSEPQKKSPMLLIAIGGIALLLVVVLVVVILLLGPSGAPSEAQRASGGVAPGVEATLGPIATLDQFIVNLLGNDSRRYLKVKISLELSNKNVGQEFDNKTPKIRDVIVQQLSTKRLDELTTDNGKTRLREELKNSINRYLIDGQVKDVFFTDFVIQ